MENKLQELTQKLFEDGLSKGKAEAAEIVEKAKKEAEEIVKKAQVEAEGIVSAANAKAESLKATTENELRLASSQLLSALQQQIEGLIKTKVVDDKISECWKDGSFIKNMVIEAVKNFNPASSSGINVVVPDNFADEIQKAIGDYLKDGVEVTTDGKVKVPFRIAPKDGSYYISFTDGDFKDLFRGYIRQRIAEILYK